MFSISRIANCTKEIDVDRFEKFVEETYLHHKQAFPWYVLAISVHRGFGHLIEAIKNNGGFGLGPLSESPLESSHKILR